MSFIFRDAYPTISGNAKVELPEMAANGITAPKVPVLIPITLNGVTSSSSSQTVFVAPAKSGLNGSYQFVWMTATFGTASASGTVTIEKATGTTAIGSGTALLQATMSLAGTANTPVDSSGSSAPVTNPDTLQMNSGDRLNVILGGSLTSLANGQITIWLLRY